MTGTIFNQHSLNLVEVELVDVESDKNGGRYLIVKREYAGGKVHLNYFSPRTRRQLPETVNRGDISRELADGMKSQYPDVKHFPAMPEETIAAVPAR